jgi:hypothetical protein
MASPNMWLTSLLMSLNCKLSFGLDDLCLDVVDENEINEEEET